MAPKQFLILCSCAILCFSQTEAAPRSNTPSQHVQQTINQAPPPASNSDDARYRCTALFANVLELVREDYVDPSKINYDALTYAALKGMLNSLDPHSQFMDPESFALMRNETEGRFSGLGVSIGYLDGHLTVNVPIEGGPAEKAGVLPGDRIVKIDGQPTRHMPLTEATKRMRGEPGQKVTLTLLRPSTQKQIDIQIERQMIDIPTVRNVAILPTDQTSGERIGYIRITQFGDKTVDEFEKAVQDLQTQNMTGLVIDLRNNPGGILEAAIEVAGKFIPSGIAVVSTEGRSAPADRVLYNARGRQHILDLPLVVLINGNSASGAEIVAGSLKDVKRAILVGETTFGKGSVQTVQPVERSLNQPVAIRLTTAHYYTPSHHTIHEVGVSPDIYAPITREKERDLFLKRSNALLSTEEKARVDSLEDVQLQRALLVLRGLHIFRTSRPLHGT